jgi:hypothetical protein
MSPAIKIIAACLMVSVAVYGLIAIVLMLLIRIKSLCKAFEECGLEPGDFQDGLRALVSDAKARPGRFLLSAGTVCAFAVFAEYILLGLVGLGTLTILLCSIEKWRGSGTEARLTGYLSRLLLMDESHRASRDSAKAAG